jgi:hypothetical protein
LTTLFKIVAGLLLLLNVAMHGTVALFIGGPFGLVLYLVGFVCVWGTGFYTLRRLHAARAKE